ncbi:hypothetical protein DUI87_18198 [Hirundo rustica rustica]|uniref:Uncharacterized protein n=1 Tax=Hirundo rustica rustica TaxID=333673 RepID=A0A3M0KCX1_HIRRU|nr:hypothetical protein DUI87_18198 [Hirundo rustica rustica]
MKSGDLKLCHITVYVWRVKIKYFDFHDLQQLCQTVELRSTNTFQVPEPELSQTAPYFLVCSREELQEQVKNSPSEKNLVGLVDEKLNMTQPCALIAQKAKCALGCTKSSVGCREREGILPLCSALLRDPTWNTAPSSGVPAQEGHGPVGVSPEEDNTLIREMEYISFEERLRDLDLFSLEKSGILADLPAIF